AYAARAGLPAVVLVPETAPGGKLAQILVHGARLVTVAGTTADCCRLARLAAERHGWVNVTTTYYCPYGVDAYATIAYELEAVQPDVLLLPISDGPLLAGMMKGFERLHRLGRVRRVPRPVAVQPAGCAPIARALEEGGKVRAWTHQHTVASALNDTLEGYERDGDYTLSWLRRFDGTAVAVSDAEIVRAIGDLAATEGLFVEPSAAAPVAAIDALLARGWLDRDARVVAVATGHGLKDVPAAALPDLPKAIAPTAEALAEALQA
ncbi:MAG: pyridoxal-phosphate dependent enzyme, partial [Rhodospirillaceae bacterium]|nr:pyridoxal-phosphate dependent enzyme [Rhodospirillaceae bacterium]